MPKNVIMPALGVAQETGRVVQWLKVEGESVNQGEALLEIETDKATVELEASASGVLRNISARDGDEVPVGSVIAELWTDEETEPQSDDARLPDETPERANGPKVLSCSSRPDSSLSESTDMAGSHAPSSTGRSRVAASPKARRLAAERGVDLNTLAGAVLDRGIVASDIDSLPLEAREVPASSAEAGRVWRIMAERTAEAWRTVPHFYLERQVDAGRLLKWRDVLQTTIAEKITLTDLLIRLLALSLRSWPQLNTEWRNGTVYRHQDINIGVAVALDEGIIVPVVRSADRKKIASIAADRRHLVELARMGRLRPADISGGTFTVSNLGMYGVDRFQAIVNPPQAAILAIGRVVQRVCPVDDVPTVRPTLVLTLSCDHRAVNGTHAARFLSALATLIEEPPQEES